MLSKYASVDVAVCTYRRASLAATLRSLSAQILPTAMSMRVIVADNDDAPSARALTEDLAAELALDHVYVHAPARNISIARNACLDAAGAPLLAFIDDDEEASPTWLSELVLRLSEGDADVVFGPVRAIYQADAPRWVRHADLHSIRPVIREKTGIETGYSCNVLFVRDRAGRLRFDPELGRSGGEDTIFFHQMRVEGARLAFAANAVVTEVVSTPRARLDWLLRRSFRTGQTHARILRDRGGFGARDGAMVVAKIAYCAGVAGLNVFSPARSSRALVRGALHCGVLGNLLGFSDLQLY